jgi:hypothetical protein
MKKALPAAARSLAAVTSQRSSTSGLCVASCESTMLFMCSVRFAAGGIEIVRGLAGIARRA